jgi:hypothetical protein
MIPLIPALVMGIELFNIVLLLLLLYVYVNAYRKVKSEFTVGLIFFVSAFLVKSLVLLAAMRALFRILDTVADTRGSPMFLLMVNVVECAGLVILLKISWE